MLTGSLHERLGELRALKTKFRNAPPTQAEVDRLAEEWSWARDPAEAEQLALCGLDGRLTGDFTPRWLAHLTGIPHATAHVGLATPAGLVLLQLRSSRKAQFPNAWDMAVTGHLAIPADAPRGPISPLEAAERELEEELGISANRLGELLAAGRLRQIAAPRASVSEDETAVRPWCDVEVRQLFGGKLTPAGAAELSYQEEELAGILICRPADAMALLAGPDAAAGAADSLRDFLEWVRAEGS
ncbi:MAG: NUDIX domain-containing protein [Actinomycetota bacterium]